MWVKFPLYTGRKLNVHVRSLEDVFDVFWTFYVRSIYVPCPGSVSSNIITGSEYYPSIFFLKMQNKKKPFTAQKMKFFIKDFCSKHDQICRKLQIWSYLLKKSFNGQLHFLCGDCFLLLAHSQLKTDRPGYRT